MFVYLYVKIRSKPYSFLCDICVKSSLRNNLNSLISSSLWQKTENSIIIMITVMHNVTLSEQYLSVYVCLQGHRTIASLSCLLAM